MPKNVLIIHASPRENGNSHTLAEVFSAGAEAAGHMVLRFNIGHADIGGCRACNHCRNNEHRCCQDDDMQEIYPALFSCDCVVFAAPLYFFGFPAPMKAMIDRLYAFGPEYLRKECVLLMTAGAYNKKVFEAAQKNFELALLDYLHWTDKGMILIPGVYAPGDIKDNPALAEVYKLGFNL